MSEERRDFLREAIAHYDVGVKALSGDAGRLLPEPERVGAALGFFQASQAATMLASAVAAAKSLEDFLQLASKQTEQQRMGLQMMAHHGGFPVPIDGPPLQDSDAPGAGDAGNPDNEAAPAG